MAAMKMQEIREALIGKTISYYSTWNGSGDNFKIGHIEKTGKSIRLRAEKNRGWGVFFLIKDLPELISNGIYIYQTEIDQCTVKETWKIS